MVSDDELLKDHLRSHSGSVSLHTETVRYFSAAGATHVVRVFGPFPRYIARAGSSHKCDVDGNEYIDYAMGHGALILGHSDPKAVAAVQQQASRGFHYGENHELEVRSGRRSSRA